MPKPVKTKKKFIDTKKERSTTFALVHRSQKDPLAADSDAPQRLLQPILSKEELKKRKDEEKDFGVFYDDDYDYLQHMKSRKEVEYDFDEMDKFLVEANEAPETESNLKLPNIVFASKEEEEIGLLNKAAPHKGPLLDWDPDIVETLDDEFKHETVYTLKDLEAEGMDEDQEGEEDADLDFILADAQDENKVIEDSEDDYTDYDSDEALDDVPSLEGGFSNFSEEETKSKFTNYSMSSSVIRRNAQLELIDDKFEKFMDGYDEEDIGGCDGEEFGGYLAENSVVMKSVVNEFEQNVAKDRQELDESQRKALEYVEVESNDENELIEVDEEVELEDKFDCESILTTYSNIYNHPKIISERSIKPIKVSGKTGIPKDVLGKGLTAAALKQLDRENELQDRADDLSDDDVGTVMTLASRVSEISFRNKHESKEEKKARKAAVKEFRRERRVERKANKEAFKEEKSKQEKSAMNLRSSCNQAIKLL